MFLFIGKWAYNLKGFSVGGGGGGVVISGTYTPY